MKMLVLSRKQTEKINIGDDLVITVLSIKGNSIRIGIDAPTNVSIRRSELDNETEPKPVTLDAFSAAIKKLQAESTL